MTTPPGEANGTVTNGNGADHSVDIIQLWRLPLGFFELSLEDQWKAMGDVTVHGKRLPGRRQPCPMAWWEQAHFIGWSLLTLGLPFAILPVTVLLAAARPSLVKYWLSLLGVLALHPIKPYQIVDRRRRIGVILARYFSMEIVVDRCDPSIQHFGTPKVDAQFMDDLPVFAVACPHGVLNFGAIIWVYFSRWISGHEQYTAGAPFLMHVPGLRYLAAALWFIHADRKTLIRHLRERPVDSTRRGGTIGIVPDGITGIFHSSPGVDSLHLGSKRGLMRIACEEGAWLAAGWFPGTTDTFTVIQDPFGILKWISRKLRLSLFLCYGRWGLPIPRRVPTAMCPAPVRAPRIERPSDEDVERIHQEVYGGLAKRFDKLKHFVGSGDRTLQLT